jgi:hypothetical protein
MTIIKEVNMKKKFNEYNLSTWSTQKLKKHAMGLWSAIYQADCFGSHDLLELQAVENELSVRGYQFQESKTLSIVRS